MDLKQKIGTRPVFLTVKVLLFGLLVSYCDASAVGKRWQEGEHNLAVTENIFSHIDYVLPQYRPRECVTIICGHTNAASRVVRGHTTSFDDFPWMAGLYSTEDNNRYCGASLIGMRTLLTAAHCFDNIKKYKVALADGKLHDIETFKIHPQYNSYTFDNDIAIIQLTKAVDTTYRKSSMHPICLPPDLKNFDKATAVVSGWGQTADGGPVSDSLQQASVPVMSASNCRENSDYGPDEITDNMICAGYSTGGVDACKGDSGGPLQVRNGNKAMELIGIVSFGKSCGEARRPGVYTKVQNYLEWIADEMGTTDCIGVDDPVRYGYFLN